MITYKLDSYIYIISNKNKVTTFRCSQVRTFGLQRLYNVYRMFRMFCYVVEPIENRDVIKLHVHY